MASLFLIAHAPLATALREVALHVFGEAGEAIVAFDVPASEAVESLRARAMAAIDALDGEVLVLTDVAGATPANIAAQLAQRPGRRAVAGVNVPMLWRALGYRGRGIEELAQIARDGGSACIQSLAPPAPQHQPAMDRRPDAPDHRSHPQ